MASGSEALPLRGGLASRARAMLQAKAMQRRKVPPRQIIDATRAWYFRDRLFDGLERYALEELQAFPFQLLEADRALKSGADDPGAVIERLVRRLSGGPAGKGAST